MQRISKLKKFKEELSNATEVSVMSLISQNLNSEDEILAKTLDKVKYIQSFRDGMLPAIIENQICECEE